MKPTMPRSAASLQHTIVKTRDAEATARLLSRVAGLRIGQKWRRFTPVYTENGVALDLLQVGDARGGGGGNPASASSSSPSSSNATIAPQHYAFLTDDAGFDAGLQALKDDGVDFWAHHTGAGKREINRLFGGRGVYFRDTASGHLLELMTVVYGDPSELDEALANLKVEEEEEEKDEEEEKKKREE